MVPLHGEQVGEGLERGAGRARGERAVDLAAARVVPIGGGNEGEDFAGGVVNDDDGGVAEVGVLEPGGFLADDGFEVALEREVEGGLDLRLGFEICDCASHGAGLDSRSGRRVSGSARAAEMRARS